MAVGLWETALAIHARQSGQVINDFLMLGRQSLALSPAILDHLFSCNDVDLRGEDWNEETWAESLFKEIGAVRVESLDYSDYEGARYVHDMNLPWADGSPPRQFDVVFDGGTLEHVFNYPQALINAMSLVKPGGCFLSVTPADGWLGHGFYQPQPELFFRFLTPERGFQLHGVWLAEFGPPPGKSKLFQIKDPALSGCRALVPGRRPLSMLVFAEKIAEVSGGPIWPGQSNYTSMWEGGEEGASEDKTGVATSLRKTVLKCLPGAVLDPIKRYLVKRRHISLARAGWKEVSKLSVACDPKTPCP